MGVRNFIVGGDSGYSGGNVNRALRMPPSLLTTAVSFNILHLETT
jgi:hypothetical protein